MNLRHCICEAVAQGCGYALPYACRLHNTVVSPLYLKGISKQHNLVACTLLP